MMQHHKYSLTEIENMLPWEREIYVGLLQNFIREENKRMEQESKKYG
jgi:DNA replication initiation complex subunit (GINS family)